VLFSGDEDAEQLYKDFAAAQSGALHETAAGVHPESDAAALRAAALKLAAEATARQAVAQRILMALSDEKKAKK
jgi:hypothetical protein